MEVTARLRYLRASAQKTRLVADLVRGRGVEEALNILRLTNKSVAKALEKLLRSAVANAENRQEHLDVGQLYVKEIFVDGGPSAKRVRPAPMGRAFRIQRRHSHVTVKLDSRKADSAKA